MQAGQVGSLLEDLLVLVSPSEPDSLSLHVTYLVLHAIHLSLVYKALKRDILLRELDADLACLVIQWSFELPMNALGADLTVILV